MTDLQKVRTKDIPAVTPARDLKLLLGGDPTGSASVGAVVDLAHPQAANVQGLSEAIRAAIPSDTRITVSAGTAEPTGGVDDDLYFRKDADSDLIEVWVRASGAWSKVADVDQGSAAYVLTDEKILDVIQSTRTNADRGKVVGVSSTNQNDLDLVELPGEYSLTDEGMLDAIQATRTTADRGKTVGVSATDEDALVLTEPPAEYTLDDEKILQAIQSTRTTADRGKVLAVSSTDEDALVLAEDDSGQALTDAQIGEKAFDNVPDDLTDTKKSTVRTRIGAGTSSFSGAANDLSGVPARWGAFTSAYQTKVDWCRGQCASATH